MADNVTITARRTHHFRKSTSKPKPSTQSYRECQRGADIVTFALTNFLTASAGILAGSLRFFAPPRNLLLLSHTSTRILLWLSHRSRS
jgi:hypothetical protein